MQASTMPWTVLEGQANSIPRRALTQILLCMPLSPWQHSLQGIWLLLQDCDCLTPAFRSINNRLGSRSTLFFGSLGYALYIGSFLWLFLVFTSSRTLFDHIISALNIHRNATPFVISAGAILGFCAALLWTAQGSLMLSYPTEFQKGKYIAVFWLIFNMGAVVGASVSLGQNFHSKVSNFPTSAHFRNIDHVTSRQTPVSLMLLYYMIRLNQLTSRQFHLCELFLPMGFLIIDQWPSDHFPRSDPDSCINTPIYGRPDQNDKNRWEFGHCSSTPIVASRVLRIMGNSQDRSNDFTTFPHVLCVKLVLHLAWVHVAIGPLHWQITT